MDELLVSRATIHSIFNGDGGNGLFEFQKPVHPHDLCDAARLFAEWSDALCLQVLEDPTLVSVNQKKVQLQDKYWEWVSLVPKEHKHRVGPNGHTCIYHVYAHTYEKLRTVEVGLSPPRLFEPPPPPSLPPPPPPLEIQGLYMGEVVE